MWLADTSLSDGIAIVIFATVLFSLLLGAVLLFRWVFRLICGKSAPEAATLPPDTAPLPQQELPAIPEIWIRLSFYSRILTFAGMAGLFSWGILRKLLKLTENEFRDTVLGNSSAWLVGILLITGLSLSLVCRIRIRSLEKQAGFTTEESTTSTILKYVLLLVILIFGLVLLLVI